MNIPRFAVVITAAGSSERFNKGRDERVKKEYLKIDGHTVLYKATEPFFEIPGLAAMVVTCPKGSEDETLVALEDLSDIASLPLLILEGGETRTESIRKALSALSSLPFEFDYIAIHDGARPFVTPEMIITTLATASVVGGACPAMRVTDALKSLGDDGLIQANVDNKSIIRVQTPQIFNAKNLFKAYQDLEEGYSAKDDVEVYVNAGFSCTVVQGSEENKKITYFKDIPDADKQIEEYLKAREEGRHSAQAVRRMRELMNPKEE